MGWEAFSSGEPDDEVLMAGGYISAQAEAMGLSPHFIGIKPIGLKSRQVGAGSGGSRINRQWMRK
jgi:hypothetical protein